MGKKQVEEPAAPAADAEDPPIIKALKDLDDKYLESEREYKREMQAVRRKFKEQQAPVLEQRAEALSRSAAPLNAETGTPALRGFWLQAMKHHPAFEDMIEEWDEPVLEYLKNITKSNVDPEDADKGFKLTLHFAENPHFSSKTLWKEYHTEETSPYTGEIDTTEIKACDIDWQDGQDVTVELVKGQKKVKGGGAKKAKAKAKETEQPRDSFFRSFFRKLKPGMPIPEDVNLDEARRLCEDSDEEDEDEMIALLMENDYEIGCAVRDQVVPFAVRWYTGEAAPEMGDSDDEDSEEDSDGDDDDDEDDSDGSPPAGKKAAPQKKSGGGGGKSKAEQKEECKQQ